MLNIFRNLRRSVKGQDLIEYALIGGLISVAAVVAMSALGVQVTSFYVKISDAFPH